MPDPVTLLTWSDERFRSWTAAIREATDAEVLSHPAAAEVVRERDRLRNVLAALRGAVAAYRSKPASAEGLADFDRAIEAADRAAAGRHREDVEPGRVFLVCPRCGKGNNLSALEYKREVARSRYEPRPADYFRCGWDGCDVPIHELRVVKDADRAEGREG